MVTRRKSKSRSRRKSVIRGAGTLKYKGKWHSAYSDTKGEFVLVGRGNKAPKRAYVIRYKKSRGVPQSRRDYPGISAAKFKKIVNSYKKKSKSKSKPKRRTYKKRSTKRRTYKKRSTKRR